MNTDYYRTSEAQALGKVYEALEQMRIFGNTRVVIKPHVTLPPRINGELQKTPEGKLQHVQGFFVDFTFKPYPPLTNGWITSGVAEEIGDALLDVAQKILQLPKRLDYDEACLGCFAGPNDKHDWYCEIKKQATI